MNIEKAPHFVSLSTAEWYSPVCLDVCGNTKGRNSVKQTLSVLPLEAHAYVPKQSG